MDIGHAKIQLIYGPMFSGKSTELVRLIRLFKMMKKKIVVIKHSSDTRYTNEGHIVTHDKTTYKDIEIDYIISNSVSSNMSNILKNGYHAVFVDEIHMFSIQDISDALNDMIKNDIYFICAGLAHKSVIDEEHVDKIKTMSDYFQYIAFDTISMLISMSPCCQRLNSVCNDCHSPMAAYTYRTNVNDTDLIGGSDKYKVLCIKCYITNINNNGFIFKTSDGKLSYKKLPDSKS